MGVPLFPCSIFLSCCFFASALFVLQIADGRHMITEDPTQRSRGGDSPFGETADHGVCGEVTRIPCRKGCGACCIAPSISSPVPGMPRGKPAGVRCIHLTVEYLCSIYDDPERPKTCRSFQATEELCGRSRQDALDRLGGLEAMTSGPTGP